MIFIFYAICFEHLLIRFCKKSKYVFNFFQTPVTNPLVSRANSNVRFDKLCTELAHLKVLTRWVAIIVSKVCLRFQTFSRKIAWNFHSFYSFVVRRETFSSPFLKTFPRKTQIKRFIWFAWVFPLFVEF